MTRSIRNLIATNFNLSPNGYTGSIGYTGSSTGGGAAANVFYENSNTISSNYTITSGKNAMSTGPITIATGVAVTVPAGSKWVVL